MPALLLAWIAPLGARLTSAGARLVIAGLLFALAGCGAWAAVHRLAGLIDDRVAAAADAVDAKWRAAIVEANQKVSQAQAAQAADAMRLSNELAAARADAATAQQQLEKANAVLPGGERNGLDAGRVRLLNAK
jgi:hypothetical protein